MADKGVRNTGRSLITVSGDPKKGEKDIFLAPGLNRLTPEQYRQIRAVKVVENYFRLGLLQDTAPPAAEVKAEEKPLEKMNKAELLAKAVELNLEVADDATNATIREAILAAQA